MTDRQHHWDAIIIGGGAAGLLAAASAGARGKRVLLLEKNTKIGVKILMSGGTRCNITHDCDIPGIVAAFGRNGKFLHSALAALPPSEVIKRINAEGVATKIESTGKIFPISNKAIDVRDALVRLATQSGAQLLTQCAVNAIEKVNDQFQLTTPQGNFSAPSIIITTGGRSYPGCGTTGDGYAWAEQFGHSIVETVPSLVPILSNCPWALELKGITIDCVNLRVSQRASEAESKQPNVKKSKPKILAERSGSFLFTHWGFSGPSVLDVSREIARHPQRKELELVADFLPALSEQQLLSELNQRKQSEGKQLASGLLSSHFPKRLNEAILQNAEVSADTRNAELSKPAVARIVASIKQVRFPINGTLGFEKAEVTAGGVTLSEVDSKTMASKLTPGLFFAGEVLDLDGWIGGFNFQSAFSTGWLAGQHV